MEAGTNREAAVKVYVRDNVGLGQDGSGEGGRKWKVR